MLRRSFACSLGLTALSASRVLGANDRIRLALIGCGGRGRYVAKFMAENPNVEYIAAADVYRTNAEKTGYPQVHQDFRRLLADVDIDAVHIATPDHWHAAISVLACEAGKDVFVEKPASLTIREGRAMVTAARKHNRIVQTGTQHRSAPHFRKIAEMIARGDIGKVNFVRLWNYSNHTPMGMLRNGIKDQPADLDWDMYLGPSPKVPWDPKRFLSTYRYYWDYSGGYITDFGNHRLDTMQQIMNVTAPKTIAASGGNFVLRDGRETPDLLTVTYEYDNFIATYEGSNLNGHGLGGRTPGHRYYNAKGEHDHPNGIAFHGTEGTIIAERIGWELYPEAGRPLKRAWENVEEPTKAHTRDFIDALRSRKLPSADIEIGHRSCSVALLGNIAFRTGKKLHWNAQTEDFINEPDASRMVTRTLRKPWDLIRL